MKYQGIEGIGGANTKTGLVFCSEHELRNQNGGNYRAHAGLAKLANSCFGASRRKLVVARA